MSDNENVRLTVFSKPRGEALTKIITRKSDGTILKDGSGCAMTVGTGASKGVRDLEHFAKCLNSLKPNQATAYGISKHKTAKITSRKEAHLHPDAITRTKGNFQYPDGPGILMLDYDPDPGQPALSRDELFDTICDACPEFYGIETLWMPSASSCIYHGDKEIIGVSGQRLYCIVDDARQIPRIGETINNRLWLAGYGRIMISKSGALLSRSPIDTSVWQPERLDFSAGAVCRGGLERRPVDHYLFPGGRLKTADFPSVSEEESREIHNLIEQAKADAEPERQEMVDRYVQTEVRKRLGPDATPDELRAAEELYRRAAEDFFLYADFVLHLDKFGEKTVGDILASKSKYHGETLADPLEPDYGGGYGKAKLFLTGSSPMINSFAHGGRVFKLRLQTKRVMVKDGIFDSIRNETCAVLADEPDIFKNNAGIVLLTTNARKTPITVLMNAETLICRAAANIAYYRVKEDREGNVLEIETDPPEKVIRAIAKNLDIQHFRPLEGVITAPTMDLEGRVISKPGYNPEHSILFHAPSDYVPPCIPESPSKDEIQDAKNFLLSPFCKFDFQSESDRAVVIAALLTAVVRRMLPSAPGFVISASTAGSGKTKLALCIDILAGGSGATASLPTRSEELEKQITSDLMSAKPVILFDNCTGHLGGNTLCALLTNESHTARILGVSKTVEVSTRTLFLFTGNNLNATGDLARRVLKINIDPGVEKPHERAFDFDPVTMVRENRQELVAAALTLMKGYIAAGQPTMVSSHMGSFEEWSRLVRQTTIWLGYEDPAAALDDNYESDPETERLRSILFSWKEHFGSGNRLNVHTGEESWIVSNDKLREFLDNPFDTDSGRKLREAFEDAINGRLEFASVTQWMGYRKGRIIGGLSLHKIQKASNRGWLLEVEQ